MATPENIQAPANSTLAGLLRGALTSVWFPFAIKSPKSVIARHDLTPEGALCLTIMVTESVSSSLGIERFLHHSGGGAFDRDEANILAEGGLFSLHSAGYLSLDEAGEQERQAHERQKLGLRDVQWLLTEKAARAMAPIYCTCKGLDSTEQDAAVKALLAANKSAVAENRKRLGGA